VSTQGACSQRAEPGPVLAAVSNDPHSATATHAFSAATWAPTGRPRQQSTNPPRPMRSAAGSSGAKIHEDSGAKTLDDTQLWTLTPEVLSNTAFLTPKSGPNFWDREGWSYAGGAGRVGSSVEASHFQGTGTHDHVSYDVSPPGPGERCGRVIRELGLPKVLSETACRGDDRQTFPLCDGPSRDRPRPTSG